jgi:hypothetical protein
MGEIRIICEGSRNDVSGVRRYRISPFHPSNAATNRRESPARARAPAMSANIVLDSEDANNVRLDVKRCCGGREMGEIRIICEGSRNDVSGVRSHNISSRRAVRYLHLPRT